MMDDLLVNSRGERISFAQFLVRMAVYGAASWLIAVAFYWFVVIFFCL